MEPVPNPLPRLPRLGVNHAGYRGERIDAARIVKEIRFSRTATDSPSTCPRWVRMSWSSSLASVDPVHDSTSRPESTATNPLDWWPYAI